MHNQQPPIGFAGEASANAFEFHKGPKVNLDLDEVLPNARLAIEALSSVVDDLSDLRELAREKKDEAYKDWQEAKTQFAARTDPAQAARYGQAMIFPAGHPEYVRMKERSDKAEKKFRSANERLEGLAQRWQSQKRLLTATERYLATLRGAAIVAVPAPSIKFPSADRLLPEIDKQRNEIATLFADRHEILSKAFPSAEIKARARAEIEELARHGCPDVSYMVNHGPSEGVIWPDYEAIARGRGIGVPLPGGVGHTRFIQAPHLPLLAWLFKDRMLQAIDAEIDANAEDEQSLSLEQRTKKLAEIDARILAAERVDVALVRHSSGAADYRDDTDPRALLGIEGPPSNED